MDITKYTRLEQEKYKHMNIKFLPSKKTFDSGFISETRGKKGDLSLSRCEKLICAIDIILGTK